ncbi:hypothetical protein OKW98_21690 [Pseudomonas sp. KU26590]|uniref:hypothetical protein n=1 Tax=Pseudomonas sp. KU26590 TaxID=2991051 RepID=UPI00223CB7F7|nr:hypothetical protein [Pseudomonas sp. KU26590]UZJ59146.1 hypothetical protein OKW98_21690 [Pseudomonas sp. KU26590]
MKTLMIKIKHECMKVLPPTVFFFVMLHIVALIRALMVKGSGVDLPVSMSVLIAALILASLYWLPICCRSSIDSLTSH